MHASTLGPRAFAFYSSPAEALANARSNARASSGSYPASVALVKAIDGASPSGPPEAVDVTVHCLRSNGLPSHQSVPVAVDVLPDVVRALAEDDTVVYFTVGTRPSSR